MATDGGLTVAVAGAEPASHLRRIFLNALSLLGAYALPRAFTFAAAVVAARFLGVATFGAYGSAAALAVILSILATLGMMQLLVREVAQSPDRAPELMAAAHTVKAVSVVVMMGALLAIAAGPLGYGAEVVGASMLLGLAYAVGAFGEDLGGYFQGTERMGPWLQAQALYGIVFGVLGIVLVVTTRDLLLFCVAPVVGQLVAVAWLLRRSPPAIRRAWRPRWPLVRRLFRSLAPFTAAFVLLGAYYKVDILLLERWRGTAEAGVYAAAYKFVDLWQALALVFAMSLYPRLSRLAGTDGSAAGGKRAAELLLLGAVPAAALLWIVRAPLVGALYGAEYGASAVALAALAPALPFLALNALGTYRLAAGGRIGAVAALYLGGLVVNVALNALFIPRLGALGAAAAMLVSEALVGTAMLVILARVAGASPGPRPSLIAAAAAVLALPMAWLGTTAVAAVVYTALVALLYAAARAVPRSERTLLWRAVVG